jgi:hypothetical protein
MLAVNFIVATNELLGGDREGAMRLVDNFEENIRSMVNLGIDSGGMRIEGIETTVQ